MPAVSKAQQRFFGMVRATQKGEMENPSSEVAKVAATTSMSSVKKFAKTKHKGLPEKKKVEEEAKRCKVGYYYCYTDKKCKKIPMGYYVGRGGYLSKDDDSSEETKKNNGKKNGNVSNGNGNGNGGNGTGSAAGGSSGSVSEEKTFAQRDKIMKRAKSLHKHLYKNLHKKDTSGDVNEGKTFKQFMGDI